MRLIRKAAPWILGALTATLLFTLLYAFSSFQYIGSDDAPILRSFMGYEGGEPATFHLYLHTALAWLLWALAKLSPGVAWFSLVQLALLWLSLTVIVKSLAQLSRRHGLTVWAGTLAGLVFLAAYGVYITCRVSYTTTAAMAGAAAVAQLASVDFTREKRSAVFLPLLGSSLLLLSAYCLRQISVLPPLCFWALMLFAKLFAAFGRGKRPYAAAKPVFTGMLATALLFGSFALVREADIRLTGTQPLLEWQSERIKLLDYTDFDTTTTPETLAKVGWSESEFTLFTYWYFLDDNISTEALRTLNAQQTADDAALTLADRARAMQTTVVNSLNANPAIRQGLWAALFMAAAGLFHAAYRRQKGLWPYAGILLAVVGGITLLLYLGWSGRLPMRAAASVLYPMAAFASCAFFGAITTPRQRELAAQVRSELDMAAPPLETAPASQAAPSQAEPPAKPNQAPPASRKRWVAPMLLWLLLCLWASANACLTMAGDVRPPQTEEETDYSDINMADLDAYARDNPDTLFIYDLSQLGDHRLFPDTPAGISGNAMFWGGYPVRTPSWYRMLAKYGITELNPSIFLRDNVLLASTDPEPWPSLMNYIAEYTGEPLEWEYYDSIGYVNIFRIYTY